MANFQAIHSVGESIRSFLRNTYPADLPTFDIQLISSNQLANTEDLNNTLTLFLHRVTVNEHSRNLRQGNNFPAKGSPLSVDLHYLMSVWAESALAEQTVLGWAMRQLHLHPILDTSVLSAEAEWQPNELIHILPIDLSNEDIMRIWDRLKPSYRLSVAYVARVVHVEADRTPDDHPVVATRFELQKQEMAL
jgi:hypothetical protein